jgi:hypothetical protein
MGLKWVCDVSGKEVFMAPPYDVVLDKDGEVVKVPVKTQDAAGKTVTIMQAKVVYKQPKAYMIRLSVGDESVQKVLCEEELNKIKLKLKEAWDLLEGL